MCVILIAPKTRPTDAMIEACHACNDKGAGIAWRQGGRVHWKKGFLSIEEMQNLAATKPLPYVLHFRIPTVGGVRKDLAHPFPIDKSIPNSLEGSTKGFVLFHNGHWGKWRDTMLEAAIRSNTKMTPGKYSDSRAMAFCASIYGLPFLDLLDEKFAAFGPGPDDIEVSNFGWTLVEGVYASNTTWQHRPAWHRRHAKEEEKEPDLKPYHTTAPASLPGEVVEEEDDQLPVVQTFRGRDHNHGFPMGNSDRVRQGHGGGPSHVPFGEIAPDVAQMMLDRGELSRKQWKKNRNAWFARIRKEKRQRGLTVH